MTIQRWSERRQARMRDYNLTNILRGGSNAAVSERRQARMRDYNRRGSPAVAACRRVVGTQASPDERGASNSFIESPYEMESNSALIDLARWRARPLIT